MSRPPLVQREGSVLRRCLEVRSPGQTLDGFWGSCVFSDLPEPLPPPPPPIAGKPPGRTLADFGGHELAWEVPITGGLSVMRPGRTNVGLQKVAVLREETRTSGKGRSQTPSTWYRSSFLTGLLLCLKPLLGELPLQRQTEALGRC